MVVGFDKFREAFRAYSGSYIVIGGSACDWLMSHESVPFRATKDIDLVIVADDLDASFVRAVWDFVTAGGYSAYVRKDGRRCLYRFLSPTVAGYPFMMEFFSRAPIDFAIASQSVITPIPVDEDDVSSLSGILLDENYYEFIKSCAKVIDGVTVLSFEALLILKARAWMDLSARKARGEFVKDRDLAKHRKDVLRLQAMIPEGARLMLPRPVRNDFEEFLEVYVKHPTDPASLNVPGTFKEAIAHIRSVFC
jgi:hypothetical protein